ncbi:hypothetical protein GCM10010376_07550 [Streptomyces violaceusniger]
MRASADARTWHTANFTVLSNKPAQRAAATVPSAHPARDVAETAGRGQRPPHHSPHNRA